MFAIFPELLRQAEKGDLEAVTCLVRKYFGENQVFAPNLRVLELCANAEIKIDQNFQKGAARLEAWDASGQFRIVISLHPDIRSTREQNYILAQMLGHVFLDLQPKMAKGELQRTIFEKKTSPLRALLASKGPLDTIDAFAIALLLPLGMVKKAMASLSSRTDAAAFFNVELPLLERRLEQIGYVSPEKVRATSVAPTPPEARAEKSPAPRAAARAEKQPTAEPLKAAPAKSETLPKQDLSSMARVNRSVAARTYKKEGERPEIAPAPTASPGMERLRQLARKIDKSVDE